MALKNKRVFIVLKSNIHITFYRLVDLFSVISERVFLPICGQVHKVQSVLGRTRGW